MIQLHIGSGEDLRIGDAKICKKVNYYISVYSDNNIEYENQVKVNDEGKIRHKTSDF